MEMTLVEMLWMVTIQLFIFSEAKGQLGVRGAIRSAWIKYYLKSVYCHFEILGGNRNQFEHYHILDEFPFEKLQKTTTSLIQKCFQKIAKDYSVMLAGEETTSRCFSREEIILEIFFLGIQWERLERKLVQNKDDGACLECASA